MIAVILAAGRGSRLRPITDSLPKCLVKVNGIPILQYQLDAFQSAGIRKIIIVTGYLSKQVDTYVSELPQNSFDIIIVENKDYTHTNNMYSFWLTKEWVDDDILLSNGDVIFDPLIVKNLAAAEQPNLVASDINTFLEENMKIAVRNGIIFDINKSIPQGMAFATSIDLYRLRKEAVYKLYTIIKTKYIEQNEFNQWTEVALKDLFQEEIFRPFDIQGKRWMEIDTPADLQEAERLFGG